MCMCVYMLATPHRHWRGEALASNLLNTNPFPSMERTPPQILHRHQWPTIPLKHTPKGLACQSSSEIKPSQGGALREQRLGREVLLPQACYSLPCVEEGTGTRGEEGEEEGSIEMQALTLSSRHTPHCSSRVQRSHALHQSRNHQAMPNRLTHVAHLQWLLLILQVMLLPLERPGGLE